MFTACMVNSKYSFLRLDKSLLVIDAQLDIIIIIIIIIVIIRCIVNDNFVRHNLNATQVHTYCRKLRVQ